MPDVALDGSQATQGSCAGVLGAVGTRGNGAVTGIGEGPCESRDLDRVSQDGPGAVRLDEADVGRGGAGLPPGVQDGIQLPGFRRGGEPRLVVSVVVDRGALDDGDDVVALPHGVGEQPQDDDAGSIGRHGAAGEVVERAAVSVCGENPPSRCR